MRASSERASGAACKAASESPWFVSVSVAGVVVGAHAATSRGTQRHKLARGRWYDELAINDQK